MYDLRTQGGQEPPGEELEEPLSRQRPWPPKGPGAGGETAAFKDENGGQRGCGRAPSSVGREVGRGLQEWGGGRAWPQVHSCR